MADPTNDIQARTQTLPPGYPALGLPALSQGVQSQGIPGKQAPLSNYTLETDKLGALLAGSAQMPQETEIPGDVGLFASSPFPLRPFTVLELVTTECEIGMSALLQISSFLVYLDALANSTFASLSEAPPEVVLHLKAKGIWFDFLDYVTKDKRLKPTSVYYAHEINNYLRDFNIDPYTPSLEAFDYKSASPEEVDSFLKGILKDCVPYLEAMMDVTLKHPALVRQDPEGLVQHLMPLQNHHSRHFIFIKEIIHIETSRLAYFLTGKSEHSSNLDVHGFTKPQDALRLIFLHGPELQFVATVLHFADTWDVLPAFISRHLKPELLSWLETLSPKTKALALCLMVGTHATRHKNLSALIKNLADSPLDEERTAQILSRALGELNPRLTPLLEGTLTVTSPEFIATPGILDISRITRKKNYEYLMVSGISPSAIASLRQFYDPSLLIQNLSFFLAHSDKYKEERKSMAVALAGKKHLPEIIRVMGLELILFFMENPQDLIRLRQISRPGEPGAVEKIMDLYRQFRPYGDKIIATYEKEVKPLRVTPPPAAATPVRKNWQTREVRKYLFPASQRAGSEAKFFEKLCEEVFSQGSDEETFILEILGKLRGHPSLPQALKELQQNPVTGLEGKRQWLIEQSRWNLSFWREKYLQWLGVGSELFDPLKQHSLTVAELVAELEYQEEAGEEDEFTQARLLWNKLIREAATRKKEEGFRRFFVILLCSEIEPASAMEGLLKTLDAAAADLWPQPVLTTKYPYMPQTAREILARITPRDPLKTLPPRAAPYLESCATGSPHPDLTHEADLRAGIFMNHSLRRLAEDPESAHLVDSLKNRDLNSYLGALPEPIRKREMALARRDINFLYKLALDTATPDLFGTLMEARAADPVTSEFLRDQLSQWTNDAGDTLSLIYWLFSERILGPAYQRATAQSRTDYIRYLAQFSGRAFGNLLHEFLDTENNSLDEILASILHLSEGDHVHFIPDQLGRGLTTPDLMFVSQHNGVRIVEVKKVTWKGEDYDRNLYKSLSKANTQLRSFLTHVDRVRRVLNLRVHLPHASLGERFLDSFRQIVSGEDFQYLDEALILLTEASGKSGDLAKTQAYQAVLNPHIEDQPTYGGHKAEHAARFLLDRGEIPWQDYPFAKAALSVRKPEDIQALRAGRLDRQLRSMTTRPELRTMAPQKRIRTIAPRIESRGNLLLPVSHQGLSPFLASLGSALPLRGN